jgi:hypothetical protein
MMQIDEIVIYMHDKTSLTGALSKRSSSDHDKYCHNSLWDVKQLRIQCREAETLDESTSIGPETTKYYVCGELQETIAPDKRVGESLHNLISLVFLVLDSGLIRPYSLNHEAFLVFRKAFGLHGTIG